MATSHPTPTATNAPPLTLAAIGRALVETDKAHSIADRAAIEAPEHSAAGRQAWAAVDTLQTRLDSLRDLATTQRPADLAGVAVALGAAVGVAYDFQVNELTAEQITDHGHALLRVLLVTLPVVVDAAGLSMEAFEWVSHGVICSNCLGGVDA